MKGLKTKKGTGIVWGRTIEEEIGSETVKTNRKNSARRACP